MCQPVMNACTVCSMIESSLQNPHSKIRHLAIGVLCRATTTGIAARHSASCRTLDTSKGVTANSCICACNAHETGLALCACRQQVILGTFAWIPAVPAGSLGPVANRLCTFSNGGKQLTNSSCLLACQKSYTTYTTISACHDHMHANM